MQEALPEQAALGRRYQAAATIAEELIRRGGDDAEARRLLAIAREEMAGTGDVAALEVAADGYESALAADPADVEAAERLARLRLQGLDDPQGAARAIDALLAAAPESPEARLAAYRFHLLAGDEARAAEALRVAARLAPPADIEVCAAVIMDALRRGRVEEARAFYEALPAAAQADRRIEALLGSIDIAEANPEQAVERLRDLLVAGGGTDRDLTWSLTRALLALGRAEEARPLIEQFRRLGGQPAEPRSRYLRGLAALAEGRPDRAAEDLRWAEGRIDPGLRLELTIALGRALAATGSTAEAVEAFGRAQRLAPEGQAPRLAAVEALLAADGPEAAITELERYLDDSPGAPELLVALARLRLIQQIRKPDAERDWAEFDLALEQAARAAPESPELPALRADRLLLAGRTDDALDALERGTDRFPQAEGLWRIRAERWPAPACADDALAALDAALDPSAVGATPARSSPCANLLAALGRGREAAAALQHGLDGLAPGRRPPLLEALARYRTARGDLRGARAAYEQWARLRPGEPAPRLALLGLALADGDEPAARAALEDLRGPGDQPPLAWRIGRAEYLLRTAGRGDAPAANARLEEAGRLVDAALAEAPDRARTQLLRAQILDRRGDRDAAVAAYRRAWQGGEAAALAPLVDGLVAAGRLDEIEALERPDDAALAGLDPDRLAAEILARRGDADAARRFIDRATRANPDASTQAWCAGLMARTDRPEQAEEALRAAVAAAPTEPGPRLALVRFLTASGRTDEATTAVDEALRLAPADAAPTLEAELRLAAGDRAGAEAALADARTRRPDDPAVGLATARFLELTGRPDEAETAYRAVLARDPANRAAARQVALLRAARAAIDPAAWQQAWDTLGPEAGDEAPEDRLARAVVLSRHPEPDRRVAAIPVLEALTDDLPPSSSLAPVARESLARLLIADGRADRAAEVAAVAAALAPSAQAQALYAQALTAAGRLVEADRQLDQLDRLAPGDPAAAMLRVQLVEARGGANAATALADAYLGAGTGEPAGTVPFGRAALARLVDLGPDAPGVADAAERIAARLLDPSPGSAWLLARLRIAQGRPDDALELARTAAEAGERLDVVQAVQVAVVVASAAGADGPPTAAEAVLEAAARRRPDDPEPKAATAMIRHMQGRYDDEVRIYRGLLADNPTNDLYRNNLAWALSEGASQPAEALELIQESIRRRGPAPDLLDTRGVILTRLGRYDEAIADLERAARAAGGLSHFRLAQAYQKAGRTADARASLEAARKAGATPAQADATERAEFEALVAGRRAAPGRNPPDRIRAPAGNATAGVPRGGPLRSRSRSSPPCPFALGPLFFCPRPSAPPAQNDAGPGRARWAAGAGVLCFRRRRGARGRSRQLEHGPAATPQPDDAQRAEQPEAGHRDRRRLGHGRGHDHLSRHRARPVGPEQHLDVLDTALGEGGSGDVERELQRVLHEREFGSADGTRENPVHDPVIGTGIALRDRPAVEITAKASGRDPEVVPEGRGARDDRRPRTTQGIGRVRGGRTGPDLAPAVQFDVRQGQPGRGIRRAVDVEDDAG